MVVRLRSSQPVIPLALDAIQFDRIVGQARLILKAA